ncbi:MAG: VTT domain-containing protein [Candidatus Berkelbacteria bacterium]
MFEIFGDQALPALIKTVGYLGIFSIVFAESGLFFGFFLPGDSLLFTAGFLASQGFLNIYYLLIIMFLAAVLGDNAGYAFGRKVGHKIFSKEDSIFFHKDNLVKAEKFYEKYGAITIILSRFIPIVRTFAPIVAGAGKMEYRQFLSYNIIGGLLWTVTMTLAGFFLVKIFPGIEQHLTLIVIIIVVISLLFPAIHLLKEKLNSKK